jgi:peptidoglycan/LPS O-acetylase OafA/YrhL
MILFAFSFVLLTKKIEIKSPLLEFLGQHIFSIYILQRIPMYILQKMRINSHPVIFSILSIIVSFILGVFFDKYIVAFVDKAFIKIRRRRSL